MDRRSRQRRADRALRLESLESRLLLSAQAADDPLAGRVLGAAAYGWPLAGASVAQDWAGLDSVRSGYGFDGSGQTVVVIDSGVAYDHPALGGGLGPDYRVVGGYDFTPERDADPYDDGPLGSHGTHVAGIIGSSDPRAPGVAPGADLIALRVFDDHGAGQFAWIEEALGWVHDHRDAFANPITTVNLSVGAAWNGDAPPAWATLEDELAQLSADGILVTVAAGNSFTKYNQPGLGYPAASPYVVPVGSIDADGTLSYFSQRSERMIAAPGRSVLSTVPDYVGNRNGRTDDFALYSGTSMAAPYVAAATMLLREAYQFVGLGGVTPQALYDALVSAADTIFDPATGLAYHRLNLDRAIDAVMPADDYGSTEQAAFDLGTLADAHQLDGAWATLGDEDWFSLVAGASGTMTISASGDVACRWELGGRADGVAVAADGALTLRVVAGETYRLGLAAEQGLGHYRLEIGLEPEAAAVDWGTVEQARFEGNAIGPEGGWFRVTAARDAILTIEALTSAGAGNVELRLTDPDGNVLATARSDGGSARLDIDARSGQGLLLHVAADGAARTAVVDFRVTNLVSRSGGRVEVIGTDSGDDFTFRAEGGPRLKISGVAYDLAAASAVEVTFDARGGDDRIALYGTRGNDSAMLGVAAAEMAGPGYHVTATGAETVVVSAGDGGDSLAMYDSAGDDSLSVRPGSVTLSGLGFRHEAAGFETVQAYASGGFDRAWIYDSPAADLVYADPERAYIVGGGFRATVWRFDAVYAYACAGGRDSVYLFDSPGDDVFYRRGAASGMYGAGFGNHAYGFEQVYGYATRGGGDLALLGDSPGDDLLGGWGRHLWLLSAETSLFGYGFERVRAEASRGGRDLTEISAVDYVLQLDGTWC